MSFIPKNPLSMPEIESTPSTPSGTRGLFPKKNGWYEVDSIGKIQKISSDADRANSLKYYGDAGIVSSDQSMFTFEIISEDTVAIKKYTGDENDVVIPYEYITDEKVYKVTGIQIQAFSGKSNITKVRIPNTITTIGGSAFEYCSNLVSVVIPDSISSIQGSCFLSCTALTDIVLGNSTKLIGLRAFGDCLNLQRIILPDGLKTIMGNAFVGCSNLTDVYFKGTKSQWEEMSIVGDNSELLAAAIHYDYVPVTQGYVDEKLKAIAEGGIGSGARSTTYYIGAEDTPNNEGLDYICSDTEGNRFNDIVDKIMADIASDDGKLGSKIIVRNGTYYQNGNINITQKCIMDFENEFESSDGKYDWTLTANNCVFTNLKSYGLFYAWGSSNTFNNCSFVREVYLGMEGLGMVTMSGCDNYFRFCSFNKDVQVGDRTANDEMLVNGNRNSFIGCKFINGGLFLAGIENVVNDCHFASGVYNIQYNGQFPETFTAYFSGNSLQTGGWAETPLYDNITAKFAKIDIVYSKDEFDMCIVDGIYKVIYQGNPCLGIISSDKTKDLRWYTIWASHLNMMLTKTVLISTSEMLSDYENLLVAAKCIQSVTIKGGNNNWTQEAVVDESGATIGYRYGQVVTVTNATITPNSKVDLQISSEQVVAFKDKALAFVAENDNGVVTVYCVGNIPENDYTIQVTVTEVIIDA